MLLKPDLRFLDFRSGRIVWDIPFCSTSVEGLGSQDVLSTIAISSFLFIYNYCRPSRRVSNGQRSEAPDSGRGIVCAEDGEPLLVLRV